MVLAYVVTFAIGLLLATFLYLRHVDRGLLSTPPEAQKASPDRWTEDQIHEGFRKYQDPANRTDVKPHLFPCQRRRYIISGGSGLVGGWIVQHLLMRGEDPTAIRILDLAEPRRPEIKGKKIQFCMTDVSDKSAVDRAFEAPWDDRVATLPLTVFHTVAYINPAERKSEFMPKYLKVNVQGTQHVLDAAKKAGATCFISTSSGSIGMKVLKPFLLPWNAIPDNYSYASPNADPPSPDGHLDDFPSCYSYSKALAETLVRDADDPKSGFRTGSIRPAHAIFGHGLQTSSSVLYDYLGRGGSPSWISHVVTNLVNAQNVSIAHLAFEHLLIAHPDSPLGGNAYCATDPNPPITYGDAYKALSLLAHPLRPAKFPPVPAVPILLIAHFVEQYTLLRHRYLPFLPAVKGDLALLQPAMFQMSQPHVVYDDSRAAKEIGYRGAISTFEGVMLQVMYFNDCVEAELKKEVEEGGKNPGEIAKAPNPVPVPPIVR